MTGSTFEGNDGNLVVNTPGNTDWANVAGRNTGIDKPTGQTDNSFGQGTKEDNASVTVVTGAIPPNKNDLTRFYEASEQAGPDNDIFLYLGWERLVNIGNANLDFEINQKTTSGFTTTATGPVTLNRTAGDLLVNYDFGGSGTPTLGLNFWLTSAAGNTVSQCFSANALPCWGKHLDLTGNAEGAVNSGTVSEPIAGGTLGAGLFGEASINLTKAGVFPAGVCEAFGSAFVKSRSSSSFTAEVKDFIAPIGVNISNCGSITINKVTTNEPVPGTQSFDYTTSSNLTGFSLVNGGSKNFPNLVSGTYTVTEGAQTAPWSFVSLICDTTTGVTITGQQVSIALGNAQNVTCTYTNTFTKAQPSVSTTQDLIPNDNFILSGGLGTVTGTIIFNLYAPSDATCAGTPALTQTKTVSGNGTYSTTNTTFHATTAGTWRWASSYSGDASNQSATSACGVEQFTIVNTAP
ncbi:hypothetical protein [Arthrobacter sp. SLBN-53]|uniref:hypothetical protein n=1 Tax=unclassified Pseudarthrobacter TaxID=2647000 RepID=UPI00114FA66F